MLCSALHQPDTLALESDEANKQSRANLVATTLATKLISGKADLVSFPLKNSILSNKDYFAGKESGKCVEL